MKSERILILNVDDYEAGRYATTRVLQQAGFTVHEAGTGEEALTKVTREGPDLIILDINLPDIDGFEVCKRLKDDPQTAHIPVLQLSAAYTGTDNRIRGLELGADGYLSQPVEPRELIANVRSLLRLKAVQEQAIASEQRLRAIVDAFALIVWRTNADGSVDTDLTQWRAFTGQTPDDVKGHGWVDAVHPDDRKLTAHAWAEAIQTGQRFETVYRLRDREGVYHYVEARGLPVHDASGAICEWIGVCLDVDDRRRAEEFEQMLGEASNVLSSSLEYSDTLMRVATLIVEEFADWVFIDVLNPDDTMQTVAAKHRDDGLDDTVEKAVALVRTADADWASQRVVRSGYPLIVPEVTANERRAAVADATCLEEVGFHSLAMLPLVSRGQIVGVVGLFSESANRFNATTLGFTEELARRIALAVDNSQLFTQAIAGNKAKSDFLAVMSHELRTPLNAIIGYTDLLKLGIGGTLSSAQTDHVSRIDISARHLLTLIDEVLTFSRLEAGREELTWDKAELSELANDCVELLGPLAANKGLTVTAETQEKVALETDPSKVRQILLNLISNAIKFTPEGSVTVSVKRGNEHAVVSVRDTGIGIDSKLHATIFEPFRQVRRKGALTSGTGLGLSVSRSLAEMLGGMLTVDSRPGKGSTFTLTLPYSRPSET